MPIAEPDEKDHEALKMANDSLKSCRTVEELQQCAEDLKELLHPDLVGEARKVFKQCMTALQK